MNEAITIELQFFLISILWGAIILLVYDILRILRRLIPHNSLFLALEDILFWVLASLFIFAMIYKMNNGTIRGFSVMGMGIGMTLYHLIFSEYLVKWVTKALFLLLRPVMYLIVRIKRVLRFVMLKIKKYISRILFRLKKTMKSVKIALYKKQQNRLAKRRKHREEKAAKSAEDKRRKAAVKNTGKEGREEQPGTAYRSLPAHRSGSIGRRRTTGRESDIT